MNAPDISLSYDDLRRLELQLFADIRRLREIASQIHLAETERLDTLQALIADHRFSIAVVGEFKRGKSTFINALLDAEVLPAAIEACSATLNRIVFGRQPHARIILRGDQPVRERTQEIGLDQLADYVTKLTPESRQMSDTVEEAVISYPTHFCRNNVDLIDTPGLNDDAVMTRITLAAISRVNAAILVIRASIPFGESEQRFLEQLLDEDIGTILFVVTAIDEIEVESRPRLIQSISGRIKRTVRSYAEALYGKESDEYHELLARLGAPRVYGLSAYEALEARRARDFEREHQSGLPTFERDLEAFLAQKDGAGTVRQIAQRLGAVAESLAHRIDESIAGIDHRRLQLDEWLERAAEQVRPLQTRWQELRRRLDQLQAAAPAEATRRIGVKELKISAAHLIEHTPVTLEDIILTAHRAAEAQPDLQLADPELPGRLGRAAAGLGHAEPAALSELPARIRGELGEAWSSAVHALQEQGDALCAPLANELCALARQLEATHADLLQQLSGIWDEHGLRVGVSSQVFAARHAAYQRWHSAALAQAVGPIQLRPGAIALWVAGRLFHGQRGVPAPPPDELIADLKGTCIRAVGASIDQLAPELRRRLAEGWGLRIAGLEEEIGGGALDTSLDVERGILGQLRRARGKLEGASEVELRDLALRRAEVARIAEGTQQLLRRLRGAEV